jgi:hypothetical protein
MTETTITRERLESAGASVAAKLQGFQEGLTPDEYLALDLALRHLAARRDEAQEDAVGHSITTVGVGMLAQLATELWFLKQWAEGYESWR